MIEVGEVIPPDPAIREISKKALQSQISWHVTKLSVLYEELRRLETEQPKFKDLSKTI